ncbi:hypothetical protein N9T73_00495 [bacterium]|nr:hypothetical protein [bacterium]
MIPNILWSQKDDYIHFKIMLTDINDLKLDFSNTLHFKCNSCNNEYEVTVDFFDEIDDDSSQHNYVINSNNITCSVKKKESKKWEYLVKNNQLYKNHIKIDWLNWSDNDNVDYSDKIDSFVNNLDRVNDDNINADDYLNQMNLNNLEVDSNDLNDCEGVQSGDSSPISSDDELQE